MSDSSKARKKADRKPARQTSEAKGSIKRQQVTGAEMRSKDLPRGSEPETRASSHGR